MGRGSGLWVPRQLQWAQAEPISLDCGALCRYIAGGVGNTGTMCRECGTKRGHSKGREGGD